MESCNVKFSSTILQNKPRFIAKGGQGEIYGLNHPRDPNQKYVRKTFSDYPTLLGEANMGIITNNLNNLPEFWGGCVSTTKKELFFAEHYTNVYTLRKKMSNDDLPAMFEKLFLQMCDAIMTLEYLGIVHSDIKPDNIMYDPQPVKFTLIDFGHAHITGPEIIMAGTRGYVPMEIFIVGNHPQYNRLTHDVWSLGVCLLDFLIDDYTFSDNIQTFASEIIQWSGIPVENLHNIYDIPSKYHINVQGILDKHNIHGINPRMIEAIQSMLVVNPLHRKLLRDYIPPMFKNITAYDDAIQIANKVNDTHTPINIDKIKYVLSTTNIWVDLVNIVNTKFKYDKGLLHTSLYVLIGLEIFSRWCNSPETLYQYKDIYSIVAYVHMLFNINPNYQYEDINWSILVDIYFEVFNIYISSALQKFARLIDMLPKDTYWTGIELLPTNDIITFFT